MSKSVLLITACLMLLPPVGLAAQVWDTDQRLTDDIANSFTGQNNGWRVTASGDTVHVVWFDGCNGNNEIYYKRSTDGGASWDSDTRLTNDDSTSNDPSIAISGSTVHVVWDDKRDGNRELYYKRSADGGANWGADVSLTAEDDSTSTKPIVAVSNDTVHVVWYDKRDGSFNIFYKRSTDGGTTWGADTPLTDEYASSAHPSIAVSGQNVHVVWDDERGERDEIYYIHSADGGATWGTETPLTADDDSSSVYPSVAVSGDTVH
ncbi:hypothetical protein GF359_02710, partial [candidate division WOR-3 bacterium]|nr:hypothetical protein [candidate division WOR-3 bacterium]MBD3364105.1 hypothetical protein [candidate division WOR-3 bacterium]